MVRIKLKISETSRKAIGVSWVLSLTVLLWLFLVAEGKLFGAAIL